MSDVDYMNRLEVVNERLEDIVRKLAESDPYLFDNDPAPNHAQCRYCGRCKCDNEPHGDCLWLQAKNAVEE